MYTHNRVGPFSQMHVTPSVSMPVITGAPIGNNCFVYIDTSWQGLPDNMAAANLLTNPSPLGDKEWIAFGVALPPLNTVDQTFDGRTPFQIEYSYSVVCDNSLTPGIWISQEDTINVGGLTNCFGVRNLHTSPVTGQAFVESQYVWQAQSGQFDVTKTNIVACYLARQNSADASLTYIAARLSARYAWRKKDSIDFHD